MKKKEILFYQVVIIALVIAVFTLFARLDNIRKEIRSIENNRANDIARLETQISSIYRNVDEQMKKAASLFENADHEFGQFNADSRTAEIHISVMPKSISRNTRLSVALCGKTTEMKKSENGMFSAVVSADVFATENTVPLITVYENGEEKKEYLEEINIEGIWSKYLPEIKGGDIAAQYATLADDKLTVEGDFFVGYYLDEQKEKGEFVNYEFITEVGGKEIARKNITEDLKKQFEEFQAISNLAYGEIDIPFKETYDLTGEDDLTVYVVAEDGFGFLHKKIAYSWEHPEEGNRSPELSHPVEVGKHFGEIITDKQGNVLIGNEIR